MTKASDSSQIVSLEDEESARCMIDPLAQILLPKINVQLIQYIIVIYDYE
jgi:hypothetical protein